MRLTIQNIIVNAIYYAVTIVAFPAIVLYAENRLGVPQRTSTGLRIAAIILGVSGIALQFWCIVLFQRIGRGTPSPALAPVQLVRSGPYRRMRNPINLGEVMVYLALAGWFGSVGLLLYALAAWLAFHLFIVYWEEPRHAQLFGDECRAYESTTPRWLPRLTNSTSDFSKANRIV